MNNKFKLLSLLITLLIILVTISLTYAFLTYAKLGQTENTITSGGITFHYQEKNKRGHGISITNALPVLNDSAKISNDSFDFKITSTTKNGIFIPYVITARLDENSDSIMGSIVDVYLTEVDDTGEKPTELFSEELKKYNELEQYSRVSNYTEKVIYEGEASGNYVRNFKLRMWIDENVEFNTGSGTSNYNDKQFSVTVNVYAEGKKYTSEEQEQRKNTNVTKILVNGIIAKKIGDIYEVDLPLGTENGTIEVITENEKTKVRIEETDSTFAYLESNIQRIAYIKQTIFMENDNYYKVIVSSEDRSETKLYKLYVKLGEDDSTLGSLSIDGCSINFSSSIYNYSCTVESADSNVVMSALPTSTNATVHFKKEDGTFTDDGLTTYHYTLTSGTNELVVRVYSEIGTYLDYNIELNYNRLYSNISQIPGDDIVACDVKGENLYGNCSTYTTLQAAVDSRNNGMIFFKKNKSEATQVEIASGKTIKLDLAGRVYTSGVMYSIVNNGILTIIDSSTGGKLKSPSKVIENNGTLTINSGSFESTDTAGSTIVNNGTFVINNGTFNGKSNNASNDIYALITNKSSLTINNGTFIQNGTGSDVINNSAQTMYINGGRYESSNGSAIKNISSGTVNINQTSSKLYIKGYENPIHNDTTSTTGKIVIIASKANSCTSSYSNTTSGLCVYSVNTDGGAAVRSTGSGKINITGGTYVGNCIGIVVNSGGRVNIKDADVRSYNTGSGSGTLVAASNGGTINACNLVITSAGNDVSANGSSAYINYSNIKFTSDGTTSRSVKIGTTYGTINSNYTCPSSWN